MSSATKAVAAACMAFALAACGNQNTSDAGEKAAKVAKGEERIGVSRTVAYDSIEELAKATPVVARVRVGDDAERVPADEAGTGVVKATVVTAEVLEAFKGELPASIPLRLLTSPSADSEVPAPLVAGDEYVLFLSPFAWEQGKPTGDWTVKGGAGIYKIDQQGVLERADRGPDELPSSIDSVKDLQGMLS